MRQGETAPKANWSGPIGGVKAPEPIVLPYPSARFARTAARLEGLAADHPAEGWLSFMAEVARGQHSAAATAREPQTLGDDEIRRAVIARIPPIAADGHRRDSAWREGLAALLRHFDRAPLPDVARLVIADMKTRDPAAIEALADAFLRGKIDEADAGAAFWIAAALQVYFTRLAARLPVSELRLLERRDLCPCCGSTASAAFVTAAGPTPGARYLCCSLCSTAWNHTRAQCIGCGGARTLSLRGVEGTRALYARKLATNAELTQSLSTNRRTPKPIPTPTISRPSGST